MIGRRTCPKSKTAMIWAMLSSRRVLYGCKFRAWPQEIFCAQKVERSYHTTAC